MFNSNWSQITNITNIVNNIGDSLNCSNPANQYADNVCAYIQRVENNTINMNNTLNNIYNIVFYINGTRWGNFTAGDIYNSIYNLSVKIDSYYNEIINRITMLQQFDEELVFLVTDSFGLQQTAKTELGNGNLEQAATRLEEANDKLSQAAIRLVTLENDQAKTAPVLQSTSQKADNTLLIALLLVLMAIVIAMYFIIRPPNQQKQQMIKEIKSAGEQKEE
jgi:hypothetical protein